MYDEIYEGIVPISEEIGGYVTAANGANWLYLALTVVISIACLLMIVLILMQKKRDAGFSGSAMTGGSGGGEEKTHFDKTKRRTTEARLERYTKILATAFMLLALLISLMT